jgi:aubergine-like protein
LEKDNGHVINPGPGTLVDTGIVENDGGHESEINRNFDFFMIANDNPKTATALPVHYKVVMNTSGMNRKEIEQFTYQQCYSYFGFGGPIKVPAAVKYAEKLAQYAFDTKSSTRKEDFRAPNQKLSYKLHFL